MNEKEVIKIIQDLISGVEEYGFDYTVEESVVINKNEYNAIQGLLDLYNKEKEKNEELLKDNKELNRLLYLSKNIQLPYTTSITSTDDYISKEKIKKLLDKYVGCYMKFYEKIQELLEEE